MKAIMAALILKLQASTTLRAMGVRDVIEVADINAEDVPPQIQFPCVFVQGPNEPQRERVGSQQLIEHFRFKLACFSRIEADAPTSLSGDGRAQNTGMLDITQAVVDAICSDATEASPLAGYYTDPFPGTANSQLVDIDLVAISDPIKIKLVREGGPAEELELQQCTHRQVADVEVQRYRIAA
jgi:hypothetical protein